MTTKKTYQIQNTQQVFCDTATNGNDRLHNILDVAWDFCEGIDPYCEWSDNDIHHIIDTLREEGQNDMADELEAELVKAYGEEEVEVVDNWQDADWGYGW